MSAADRNRFLARLDAAVWVPKRLFPSRLVVLDKLDSSQRCHSLVLDTLRDVSYATDFGSPGLVQLINTSGIAEMAILIRSEGLDQTHTPEARFLRELNDHGLRDALAYAYDVSAADPDTQARLEQVMLDGYTEVGTRFLARADEIKSRLEEVLAAKSSDSLGRLVWLEGLSRGVWEDGEVQQSQASV